MVLLVVTALLLALAAAVLIAPPVGAHPLGGVEPSNLRTGGRLVDVVGEVRRVPGPSPLPWLAGAALLAMVVVVVAGRTRRWTGALVAALGLLRDPAVRDPAVRDPAVRDPAVDGRDHPTRGPAVDNREHATRGLARLPLRGPQQPEAGYPGAQRPGAQRWPEGWVDDPDGPDLTDPELPEPGRVPELHVVGGRTRRVARERAAVTSTSATVLPWPGPRRPSSYDHDPDLPGGA